MATSRPYKTTGCFRFALFMIILAPLAYLGASYYNGQDGLQNVKNLFQKAKNAVSISTPTQKNTKPTSSSTDQVNTDENQEKIIDLQSAIGIKDKEINALIEENLELKMKLKVCETKPVPAPKNN